MIFIDLSESQLKQYINAEQVLQSWRNSEERAKSYRGGMIWREQKGNDYLVKTGPDASQRGVGVRSDLTEKIYLDFIAGKRAAQDALVIATKVKAETERMNKALRLGRCPNVIVDILDTLHKARLSGNFMVIGTNALYAYEAHAGVRFEDDITATVDVDFLWDSRKQIAISVSEEIRNEGFLGLLKKADPSFRMLPDQPYSASNAGGYIVDLIKRRPKSLYDDREAQQLFPNPDDFWAAKIHNMDWLLSAPKFTQTVISLNGKFTNMTVPDPRAFVLFKIWMARQESREPTKKPRDLKQARAMLKLIEERMPHLDFAKLHVFPESLRSPILNSNAAP